MKCRTMAAIVMAMTLVLWCSSTTLAAPQDKSDTLGKIYQASATVPTNVTGVHTYPDPPVGFNPLEATDEALASYGFPPRPNISDPGYKLWARAMAAAKYHRNEVKAMPYLHTQLKPVNRRAGAGPTILGAPTELSSGNWSGVADTNSLTKWGKTSFGYVYSIFNVTYAQPPFGACANGIDGPFIASEWNGIDGASGKEEDVVQGGSLSYSDCGGPQDNSYCAWVEWYPSYPTLCQFDVNPGDIIYVVSYDQLGGTNPANVFVEDLTTLAYASVSLQYLSGPPELGDSAEWIVERPGYLCGDEICLYALNNYIDAFANNTWATNVAGTVDYFPGSTAATTQLIFMVNDADTEYISLVNAGSEGLQGKEGLWFEDDNCAYSGGCTP